VNPPGRIVSLRAHDVALVLDLTPDGAAIPAILHLGDADAAPSAPASAPPPWGARLDKFLPLTILPHEQGCFGPPAIAFAGGYRPRLSLEDVSADARAIEIILRDRDHGTHIIWRACVFGEGFAFDLTVAHAPAPLLHAASLVLPLSAALTRAKMVTGDWAREFQIEDIALGTRSIASTSQRGRPGHDSFPGLYLHDGSDRETLVLAAAMSGNHDLRIAWTREHGRFAMIAEPLSPGWPAHERYDAPRAHVLWSKDGINGAMAKVHRHLRNHVMPPRAAPRPIHLNSWEAVYFDVNESVVTELADQACAIGAERLVLDDGWFENRNNDKGGLGDWTPDPVKFPHGLGPVANAVREKGLSFGIWVEPEMVNPDSHLWRTQPAFHPKLPDHERWLMRHQHVLDFGDAAVRDHVLGWLKQLLHDTRADYIKWDMNRDLLGDALSHARHARGLHAVMDELRVEFPDLAIETCASGGGRADWGMLARTDRVWVSDNIDAMDRLSINRGAALFLPLCAMGTHAGAARSHISGKRHGLDLRAHVAMFGAYGYELDPRRLRAEDLARFAAHSAAFRQWRAHIHGGQYRLHAHPALIADSITGADGRVLSRVVNPSGPASETLAVLGLPPGKATLLSPVSEGVSLTGRGTEATLTFAAGGLSALIVIDS